MMGKLLSCETRKARRRKISSRQLSQQLGGVEKVDQACGDDQESDLMRACPITLDALATIENQNEIFTMCPDKTFYMVDALYNDICLQNKNRFPFKTNELQEKDYSRLVRQYYNNQTKKELPIQYPLNDRCKRHVPSSHSQEHLDRAPHMILFQDVYMDFARSGDYRSPKLNAQTAMSFCHRLRQIHIVPENGDLNMTSTLAQEIFFGIQFIQDKLMQTNNDIYHVSWATNTVKKLSFQNSTTPGFHKCQVSFVGSQYRPYFVFEFIGNFAITYYDGRQAIKNLLLTATKAAFRQPTIIMIKSPPTNNMFTEKPFIIFEYHDMSTLIAA